MPFSSTAVFVQRNDQLEIRYPTPSTWRTSVTFQVQIGTGNDPNGVTLATRVPDAKPDVFQFLDSYGSTNQNASLPGDFTTVFQRNTFYYSSQIVISGIELRVPIKISTSASGPRGTYPNLPDAGFSINNGPYITVANQSVTKTGTTVAGSKTITGINTTGLTVGMYLTSSLITGEITNISGSTVTVVEPASGSGTTTLTGYFTVRSGDLVRLRIKTEDWYTTNTNVTLTVSDNYWTTGDEFSETWSITTRAQDQLIDTLTSTTFFDYVDVSQEEFGGYKTQDISIVGIDADAVLRATSTGNVQIRKNGTGSWVQSLTGITLNDTLNTRISIGSDYTTKTTGNVRVFAVGGETLSGGFENNNTGTYGTGSYAITQTLGDTQDSWQVWTEVDRYPDIVGLDPIFTFSDVLPRVSVLTRGSGYTDGQTYTTTAITGSGSGLTVKVNTLGTDQILNVEIIERGSGYTENDIIRVNGGNPLDLAQLIVIQYRKVTVSTTNTLNNAEPGFTYYCDLPISGLGVEYPTGTYSDLEVPLFAGFGSSATTLAAALPLNTSIVNGSPVQIQVNVTQGSGEIRKNGAGAWVQQIFVQNGDVLNFRIKASDNYDTQLTSSIRFVGPPNGGPAPGTNPTNGPNTPTFPEVTDTITIRTRSERLDPYPFKAQGAYNVDRGSVQIAAVPILGLDRPTQANIVSADFGTNAGVSLNSVDFFTSVTINPSIHDTLYIRHVASNSYSTLTTVTYEVGSIQDTFLVKTLTNLYEYTTYSALNSTINTFLPQWADTFDFVICGAGGGNGGDDAPNSFGGIGGKGNVLVGRITIPPSLWPDPDTRKIRIYTGLRGQNGVDLSQGGDGGLGGWGYAIGGDGGNSSTVEYSGSGGGGGGASAIVILDPLTDAELSVVGIAGGGGGGGGAGADTVIQKPNQNGNFGGGGPAQSTLSGINLSGSDGQDNLLVGGGGGGGGGGGWGTGGSINTVLLDEFGGVIGTFDLDANGGTGGGWFYDPSLVELDIDPEEAGAGPSGDGYVTFGFPPQDRDPDPFSILPVTGVQPLTEVVSEYIQIKGITGTISASIISNGTTQAIRVCTDTSGTTCGAWSSGVTVRNDQYIQVKMTTGALYNLNYRATVQVGNLIVFWDIQNGEPPDNTPTPFNFQTILDAPINTVIESEQVIITGINSPTNVLASNGAEYRIGTPDGFGGYNFSSWINGDLVSQITNNSILQIRITSSPNYDSQVNSVITVGNVSTTWTVGTGEEPDLLPDSFIFLTRTNLPLNTLIYSNYVDIEGISEPIQFTVTGGALIERNGVQTGLSSILAEEFDLIRLYYTTSNNTGESITFNVTAGTFSTSWTVTNTGIFGIDPDPFTFPTIISPDGGINVNSNIITLQGLTSPSGISIFGTNGIRISINGGSFQAYTASSPYVGAVNGNTIQVQLTSPAFAGFSITGDVIAGSYQTSFTVVTAAPQPDPILGQWYSSLNMVQTAGSNQVKYNTKFDGLPVGSMMPVFKETIGAGSDSFGELDGSVVSRFPGWILCDGQMVFPSDYPALYEVIGNTYGADISGRFRLPDMRNKKVVGTGPVDGNQSSSPSLAPDFGPAKTTAGRSNNKPGSHGGLWFISKVEVPSNQVIPQVNEPSAGLTPTESQFFNIGLIRTTGYAEVTGSVEFITTGNVTGLISLGSHKQTEIPYHTHLMLSGVPDQSPKGRVFWGGRGGRRRVNTPNEDGGDSPAQNTTTVQINLWGYCTTNIDLTAGDGPNDNIILSSNSNQSEVDFGWHIQFGTWDLNSGYLGDAWNASPGAKRDTVTYRQTGLRPGQAGYNEIDEYINLSGSPFSGTAESGTIFKWVGAVDIPERSISVKSFRPLTSRSHTHYITLTQISGNQLNTIFSYGNSDGPGTSFGSLLGGFTTSVEIEFEASNIGLEVLPGLFTLNTNKQLIPTPALDPQTEIPLITPYTWVRWLIKAY